jgi:Sulfotransferase family
MSAWTIAPAELLVERAEQETGLSDFGPGGWQEGLEQLIAAVPSDIGTDTAAIEILERMFAGRLANRLRVEDWYAEHGSEANHGVEGPVVILGLPRTATTALQYLLAVDPQFRYQRRWEVADPVPPPRLASEDVDPRRLAATASQSVQHISTADGPMEDGPVLALNFHHQELGLPLPTYTRWWRTSDVTSTYAYHERVLRLLHAHRPPYRWLLKAPAYCFHLQEIAGQYPDARFLMTHRDPVIAFASACSVVREAQQMMVPSHRRDPAELGASLLEHLVEAMRRAMAARDALGEDRFLDVYQEDVEARPLATVNRIYGFLGLRLTDEVRLAMECWTVENRRGSRGEHRYSAEEFGCDQETVRLAFHDYLERFGRLSQSRGGNT